MNKTNKTNTDNTFQQGLEGTGAGEWAKVSYNIAVGCPHNCIYCYARGNARHFNWIPSLEDWPNMRLIPERVAEAADKFCGTSVMYPSTHDITPEILSSPLHRRHFARLGCRSRIQSAAWQKLTDGPLITRRWSICGSSRSVASSKMVKPPVT